MRGSSAVRRIGTYTAAPIGRAGLGATNRFVIYCPPRTGSDLLVSLLNGHPQVRCDGEILNPPIPHPLSWFDGRAALTRLRGRSAWGCKIITLHLRWHAQDYGPGDEFLGRLVELGYTVICLRRRDWLLQALSLVHAARTKYHFAVDDDLRFSPMSVDLVHLLHCLYVIEEEDEVAVATMGELPRIELWYEDDLLTPDRQQVTLNQLTDALSVHRIEAKSRVAAGAPPTLQERVANLDELVDLVGRTRFARFLDSSPPL